MSWFDYEVIKMLAQLAKNSLLLFGLSFIYTIRVAIKAKNKILIKILLGILTGIIALFIMSSSLEWSAGLIFDTRTVLYSITGLFFGNVVTIIAAAIGIIFRIIVGGAGVVPGVTTIIISSALGLIGFNFFIKRIKNNKIRYLYIFLLGVINGAISVTIFALTLSPELVGEIVVKMLFPHFVIFPIAGMILAFIINIQRELDSNHKKATQQNALLQSLMDSNNNFEIYALDKDFNYLVFNEFHASIVKDRIGKNIKRGQPFAPLYNNLEVYEEKLSLIRNAFAGQASSRVIENIETNKYCRENFFPIFSSEKEIIGVLIDMQDITEQKHHEESILYLSYHDTLTKIPNRRFYEEKVKEYEKKQFDPLSIINIDVNGLKTINDIFGHLAGDELLNKVASQIKAQFSKQAGVFRMGGDEFLVLLPNTTAEEAKKQEIQFKKELEKERFRGLKISISTGAATREEKETFYQLYNRSDNIMYNNKFQNIITARKDIVLDVLGLLYQRYPCEQNRYEITKKVAKVIAKALNLSLAEQEKLDNICLLHDIGMITISKNILTKTKRLTEEEWEKVSKHPEKGVKILATTFDYLNITDDILSHHERYDGSGFPRQLAGEKIPLNARIFAIADAYGVMVSDCPYQKIKTKNLAAKEIEKNSGSQFDPKLVKIFLENINEI